MKIGKNIKLTFLLLFLIIPNISCKSNFIKEDDFKKWKITEYKEKNDKKYEYCVFSIKIKHKQSKITGYVIENSKQYLLPQCSNIQEDKAVSGHVCIPCANVSPPTYIIINNDNFYIEGGYKKLDSDNFEGTINYDPTDLSNMYKNISSEKSRKFFAEEIK